MKRKEYIKFLMESKKFIYSIIFIFFTFFILGFLFPSPFESYFKNFIKEIVDKTKNLDYFGLFIFILYNNLKTSFFGMIFGIFLGIMPIFLSIINGYLIGFVSRISVKENGFIVLTKILPHGIFELPAVFISFGLGLQLGLLVIRKERKMFMEYLRKSLEIFLFVVFPLLIVAAIIESSLIFLWK